MSCCRWWVTRSTRLRRASLPRRPPVRAPRERAVSVSSFLPRARSTVDRVRLTSIASTLTRRSRCRCSRRTRSSGARVPATARTPRASRASRDLRARGGSPCRPLPIRNTSEGARAKAKRPTPDAPKTRLLIWKRPFADRCGTRGGLPEPRREAAAARIRRMGEQSLRPRLSSTPRLSPPRSPPPPRHPRGDPPATPARGTANPRTRMPRETPRVTKTKETKKTKEERPCRREAAFPFAARRF